MLYEEIGLIDYDKACEHARSLMKSIDEKRGA